MEEQLVSFETAKLAKEKGFYEMCKDGYILKEDNEAEFHEGWWLWLNDNYKKYITEVSETNDWKLYGVPTQSLLQKWLRDEHKLVVLCDFEDDVNSQWGVSVFGDYEVHKKFNLFFGGLYKTYEEALEEGLYQALLLIKT
jgi:hypothetical protein